jgi:hypothetical protein
MADNEQQQDPAIDIAPEQKAGPVALHMTFKEAVLDLPNADYVAGIARVGDTNYYLDSGKLQYGQYMGLIIDMMTYVDGMMARLPPAQQKQIAVVVAERARLQRITGRLNRGVAVPDKKIVTPGKEN